MYLHEAMEKLFRQVGRSMTTKEIAEKLNENKWYRKADGSLITPYQIYGRAKGVPRAFFIVKVRQFLSRGVQQEKLLLRELPSNMFAYLKIQ